MGAVIGGGRHEDGAARDDVGDDFFAVIGGVDYVRSFEVVSRGSCRLLQCGCGGS